MYHSNYRYSIVHQNLLHVYLSPFIPIAPLNEEAVQVLTNCSLPKSCLNLTTYIYTDEIGNFEHVYWLRHSFNSYKKNA